jgi:hypothetical protein
MRAGLRAEFAAVPRGGLGSKRRQAGSVSPPCRLVGPRTPTGLPDPVGHSSWPESLGPDPTKGTAMHELRTTDPDELPDPPRPEERPWGDADEFVDLSCAQQRPPEHRGPPP